MTRLTLGFVVLVCVVSGCSSNRVMVEKAAPVTSATVKDSQEKGQRTAEAIAEFDRKRDEAQWQAALAFSQRGDREACAQSLAELLDRNPEHAGAHLLMAEVLVDEAPQQAIQHAEAVLTKEPDSARAQQAKALALEHLRPYDAVPASYQAPVSGPAEILERLPAISAAVPRGNAADTPSVGAQPEFAGAVVNIDSSDPVVTGGPNADQEFQPPLSTRQTLPICALHPVSAIDDLPLQSADFAGGGELHLETQPTEPSAAMPLQAEPTISALQPALQALQSGSHEDAIGLLREELAKSPQSAELHRTLALAHYRQADYQAAHQALTQALSLDNANAASYFLMGCTLTRLGQPEAAEQHYQLAGRLDPKYGTLPDRR